MPDAPIHATTVAIHGRAMLILGPSGAGKSDLALRLIDRGANLVSDDYTVIRCDPSGRLRASAPASIAGRMEVRHIGIINLPWQDDVSVALAVQLEDRPSRMPEMPAFLQLAGVDLPLVALCGHESSATIKAELALERFGLAGPIE